MQKIKEEFNKIGWFIPPYIPLGKITRTFFKIGNIDNFYQNDLELILGELYTPSFLSSMLIERYSKLNNTKEYKLIIKESIEAHFLGLNYVAISGLLPVIEGVIHNLIKNFNIEIKPKKNQGKIGVKDKVSEIIRFCINTKTGKLDETEPMLESFLYYIENHLFIKSTEYILDDKTNRHGILHGEFSDKDYGKKINFYKVITVLNMLCFIASYKESFSWLGPEKSKESIIFELYLYRLLEINNSNIKINKLFDSLS